MKRVYIAGPFTGPDSITVFDNMRRGIRLCVHVLTSCQGWAPFCPWLDFLFILLLRPPEILTLQDCYEYSLAWLEVSDVLLVLPGYENSKGTCREIARAKDLKIPVYYSLQEFRDAVDIQEEI